MSSIINLDLRDENCFGFVFTTFLWIMVLYMTQNRKVYSFYIYYIASAKPIHKGDQKTDHPQVAPVIYEPPKAVFQSYSATPVWKYWEA